MSFPQSSETRDALHRELLWTRQELETALLQAEDQRRLHAEAKAALVALHRSTSWRITAPLRWLRRIRA